MKVTGEPASPAAAAVIVFAPAVAPNVQLPTDAMPDALVVGLAPLIEPPPLATANVTLTPLTPLPSASMTFTEGGVVTTAPTTPD